MTFLGLHRKAGWIVALILLGLYLFLKLQGWWFASHVRELEQKLEGLRPTLSAIVLSEQLQANQQVLTRACDEVSQLDLGGRRLLEQLSQQVPASVAIQTVEVRQKNLRIQGTCLPGVRSAEAVVNLLSKQLEKHWPNAQVVHLVPDKEVRGLWRFDLKAEGA